MHIDIPLPTKSCICRRELPGSIWETRVRDVHAGATVFIPAKTSIICR